MNKDVNDLNKSDNKDSGKKNIISSAKRNANKSLEYWTKDKMEEAKPIPLPREKPKEE